MDKLLDYYECIVEGNQMQVLCLRFLTEIDENTREVPKEFRESRHEASC